MVDNIIKGGYFLMYFYLINCQFSDKIGYLLGLNSEKRCNYYSLLDNIMKHEKLTDKILKSQTDIYYESRNHNLKIFDADEIDMLIPESPEHLGKNDKYLYTVSFSCKTDKNPTLYYFFKKQKLDYIGIIEKLLVDYTGIDDDFLRYKKKKEKENMVRNIVKEKEVKIYDIKTFTIGKVLNQRTIAL